MVSGEIWRGQQADLILEDPSGTEVTVGALQDAEINIEYDTSELMGDSIKRLDKQKTAVSVNVTATWGAFTIAGLKTVIDYSESAGGLHDTPEMPEFKVRGKFTNTSGTTEVLEVKAVTFDDISLPWSRDEYVTKEISGDGNDIEFDPTI